MLRTFIQRAAARQTTGQRHDWILTLSSCQKEKLEGIIWSQRLPLSWSFLELRWIHFLSRRTIIAGVLIENTTLKLGRDSRIMGLLDPDFKCRIETVFVEMWAISKNTRWYSDISNISLIISSSFYLVTLSTFNHRLNTCQEPKYYLYLWKQKKMREYLNF